MQTMRLLNVLNLRAEKKPVWYALKQISVMKLQDRNSVLLELEPLKIRLMSEQSGS